ARAEPFASDRSCISSTGRPATPPGCVRAALPSILNSSMILKDRSALITGSGRGIGAAIAATFAKHGASVFLTARTESELAAHAASINAPTPASGTATAAYATADRTVGSD